MNLTLLAFTIFICRVLADVSIAKPSAGQTFAVSGSSVTVDISWLDSGTLPKLSDAQSYTFTLCTGSNSDITAVTAIATNKKITDNTFKATIPSTAGSSGVYYIQVYAQYPSGSTIHYSNRFALSGMTGSTKAVGVLGDLPPSAQFAITTGAATTALTAGMDVTASFTVPYTKQTGIVRFAPMQMQPGSTVTAKTWTRQFPTSSVSYFVSPMKSAVVQSTITPGWSYTKTSYVNNAKALGTPTAAYPASKNKKTPTINSAYLSKRFLHWD